MDKVKNMTKSRNMKMAGNSGGGMVYCLGIIGSMVYWIQQAEGFWAVTVAILKAFVWPAFVVYDVLKYIS